MPTLRISTVMILIAVVAICLGAILTSLVFGVLFTFGVLPASIRTAYLSDLGRFHRKPLGPDEKLATFLTTLGTAYLVSFASLIAFGVTCFPIGIVSIGSKPNNPDFVWVYAGVGLGLVVAIFVAVRFSRFLLRAGRRKSGSDQFQDWSGGPG
ncbi:hypothetical protein P12x_005086 [Tundrisphaera lichenicola]|uniref:hypothetical protein n=1 Tax=Tundrisphaera lichenicola TaxID=2029860 RepID=UPI003EBD0FC3